MRILLVDDQAAVRRTLRRMLTQLGDVEIIEASSMSEALVLFDRTSPDVLLLDIRLSSDPRDRSGLELLRRLRAQGLMVPAIMVTGVTDITDIREALRLGASDYVLKEELEAESLVPIVENIRERAALRNEVLRLRDRVSSAWGTSSIIGSSAAIERVRQRIARVADANATILIRGETGTGKEMVARALHGMSARRDRPFVPLNCSALPSALMESLLFGHERGAFTGADRRVRGHMEQAGNGTLLLDEIAELPLELQAKLLRVLEDRRFRPLGSEQELPLIARVLASTHVNLEERIARGQFREDLYYRLNVVTIDVPSLAERIDDIPLLLSAFAAELPRPLRFSEKAVEWLMRRPWPGNVRELRNVVERLSLLSDGDEVDIATLEELAAATRAPHVLAQIDQIVRGLLTLPDRMGSKLDLLERAVLLRALDLCQGNKSAAARLVGIDRKVLERRLERYDDEKPSDDGAPDSPRRPS